MTVFLVGAGPGDRGLLTLRGAKLLAEADVVIHDRLVDPSVLALAPATAVVINVGKRPDADGDGQERQAEIHRLLIHHGRQAGTVVRLKGGDPFLFGRGGEEVEALAQAGIPCVVVPGVTSAFGVPAAAGIPVTHRGLSTAVTVVTGRVGDPTAPGGVDWEALAQVQGTLVILMGMATRGAIAEALQRAGKPADTPTAVIEQGTTSAERVVRTTLDQLAAVDLGSPSVIVIGPVAALGAASGAVAVPVVPAGNLTGRTVVVTRAAPRARGLVEALREAGAAVIEVPLTTQTDPADGGAALRAAAAHVASYDWVVLTSANGVDRFMAELRDARALGTTLVAAVGPASADALRMAGVEPDLVPAESWAKGLIEEFPDRDPDLGAGRILFPCADQAPPTIVEGLGEKGWEVTRVEAYRTVPLATPEPALLERMGAADAVTFTATSSIKAFLNLRGPDGSPVPVPPCVVCIGPTTAASARALGMEGVEEAWGANAQGMVDVLVHRLGQGQHAGS
jgi:uroporphyrinogen III methyltransferase/synthase